MNVPPPMWTATAPPFTVAQWQELEHQALIFKYLKAGLTVPPDLLAPIRNSLLRHQPSSLGYYSYYGKKIDPEPGRCRRTDGKKWRCSKEAHPDSKYCERHMIRRRYRSRKPVESSQSAHPAPPPQSSADAVSADVAAAAGSRGGFGSGGGTFQNLTLHTNGAREGFSLGNNNNNNNNNSVHQLQIEPFFPSEVSKKEYRYI